MSNFGVIGASGFVGQHLSEQLVRRGHSVRAIVRTAGSAPAGTDEVPLGDFATVSDWNPALVGLDVIICLAARAHVIKETSADPLAEFRKINVEATANIAKAAAEVGVSRFIFLSSIGVNGEVTHPGSRFSAADIPNPQVPYAVSKLEAEVQLQSIHESGGLDVVIVRSPLVYGAGAKGNFLRLLRLIDRGVPLPLGSATNPRAMISIGNLSDALIAMADSPRGERMLAVVNDPETFSTADLIRRMATAMEKSARLIPSPAFLLKGIMSLIGMGREAGKLLDPLEVEISGTWAGFNWKPPLAAGPEIEKAARWYLHTPHGEM